MSTALLAALTAANASSVALALSDGTPVEFVKVTSKNNIQVRVPDDHILGDDPLRIFRRDGTHYKDQTSLTLVASPAAEGSAAPISAAGGDTVYEIDDVAFDNFDDARREAIDLFSEDPSRNVEIFAVTRKVVGVVGFVGA